MPCAAALFGGYAWTQTRFFVGTDAGSVVIFQGIPQDLGPIPLSHVYKDTEIRMSDLPAFDQSVVENTIYAGSLQDAQSIVDRLRTSAEAGKKP